MRKALFAFIVLSFLLAENSYACGHCFTKYMWHKSPFFLGIFMASVCYGAIVYLIYGILRQISFRKFIGSFLIFSLCSYILYFLATEGMYGLVVLIPAAVFCYVIPPWRLYKKASLENDASASAVRKTRNLTVILIPVFLSVSFVLSNIWQKKTDKYFDAHLVEMLNMKSVSLNLAAAKSLMAIKDVNERSKYIPELRELLSSGTSLGRSGPAKVLAEWKDNGAVPAVLQAWQKKQISDYEAAEALRILTNQNFSKLEQWQTWLNSKSASD